MINIASCLKRLQISWLQLFNFPFTYTVKSTVSLKMISSVKVKYLHFIPSDSWLIKTDDTVFLCYENANSCVFMAHSVIARRVIFMQDLKHKYNICKVLCGYKLVLRVSSVFVLLSEACDGIVTTFDGSFWGMKCLDYLNRFSAKGVATALKIKRKFY